MKYYLVAGEASGDMHASHLIRALRLVDREAEFRGRGGELMQQAGMTLVQHYRDLAYMGFLEVVTHLGKVLREIKFCVEDIKAYRPDAVILIDFPGFNLQVARQVKALGLKVFYYISPQLWAWNASRVKRIKKYVDRMIVILPFEQDFYRRWNYEVDYAGHPLVDIVEEKKRDENFLARHRLGDKPIIALLSGSRRQEVIRMLPVMLSVTQHFPQYHFVVAGTSAVPSTLYEKLMNKGNAMLVYNKTYDLLQHAKAAIVTSGTATLETALFNVPQVVCYKGNFLSFLIAKMLVRVPYISLVNLILEKQVVPELIQSDFTSDKLKKTLHQLLFDDAYRTFIREQYTALRQRLGTKGASQRAAAFILAQLKKK